MNEESKARILIVEDELDLLELIMGSVERIGHIPYPVTSGEEALRILEQEHIDMILLDVMLPGINGQELCKRIRVNSDVPIMVLSAMGRSETVVEMLELGADEYVKKPFHFSTVEALIGAQLRRSPWKGEPKKRPLISSADLKLDMRRKTVQVGRKRILLSDRECSTLSYLIEHAGAPVDTHQICMAVWGEKSRKQELALVQTAIQRLRAKIEPNPRDPKYIMTVRGYGYKVNATGTVIAG